VGAAHSSPCHTFSSHPAPSLSAFSNFARSMFNFARLSSSVAMRHTHSAPRRLAVSVQCSSLFSQSAREAMSQPVRICLAADVMAQLMALPVSLTHVCASNLFAALLTLQRWRRMKTEESPSLSDSRSNVRRSTEFVLEAPLACAAAGSRFPVRRSTARHACTSS
jgi:hypothetical protein